jgi:hypothetical protein
MLKKTRHRLKRLFKRKRKTRRLRGGSTNSEKDSNEKDSPIELTDDEKRTNKIVKGVVTDVMTELKKEGVLEKGGSAQQSQQQTQQTQQTQSKQRQDTFSENRPTGMVEQILLAPVRIPAKLIKLPFKLYKAPFKFLKKLVF